MPVALVYPNHYAVGMSSLGFQLVYALLNEQGDLVCERFFLPEKGDVLRSVESARSLADFPLLFFSLSFEHDYLHLVEILLAAGIAPYAEDRGAAVGPASPLVLCGGVATFINPEPFAPFVDLIVVGEAEPILPTLVGDLAAGLTGGDRVAMLTELCQRFPSCYAPILHHPQYAETGELLGYQSHPEVPSRIVRSVLDHSEIAGHSQLLTPLAEFSELYLTELGRGCSRGCRFCAAGFVYRPPRLWDAEAVLRGLAERFADAGRVGLLGMEMADSETLGKIANYLQTSGCALSFSSLRADRLSESLLALLGDSKLKSVAIAPDGSSERLRRVINKNLTEEDLLKAAEELVGAGIFKLKIYLMIGLPTETDADLEEAVALIGKIKQRIDPIGKERGRLCEIQLSINCFVPKAWTPFQYHCFGQTDRLAAGELGSARATVTELKRRLQLLHHGLRPLANVHLQHDKPEHVLFQAVLAKGDRRLAPVLLAMAATGLPWGQAMKKCGLTAEQFALRGYDQTTPLPWDIIDHGFSSDYLWQEYLRAFAEKPTSACDTAHCRRCGVCHD